MGHGLVWWVVVGLCAGLLGKALVPGDNKEPSGCIMTMLLGIVGSVTMGFVMELVGFRGQGGLVATIVGAALGSALLIILARKFAK